MQPPNNTGRHMATVRIDDETATAMRIAAAALSRTLQDVLDEAARDWLDKNQKPISNAVQEALDSNAD